MSGAHEPRQEFLNQLELQLRADLRRRRVSAGARTWLPHSRVAAALAIAALVILSMALGGGVVAAAYHSRLSEQRDVLLAVFEQRAAIATQRLALANQQLLDAQERVSIGVERPETVADLRFKVKEAEAELKSIELDIAEIRAAGREPMHAVSAPLVSGRDFVTERWRVEMSVPAAALELEKQRAAAARTRFEVGLADAIEVETAEARVIELQSALEVFNRKAAIRGTFLKGDIPAAVADLRGLEAETDLRRTALAHRIDFVRTQTRDVRGRMEVGTATPLDLAQAEMRLQELQLALSKAEYELLLIRKQLGK